MRTIVQIHHNIVTIKVLFYLFKKKTFAQELALLLVKTIFFFFTTLVNFFNISTNEQKKQVKMKGVL